MFKQLPIDITDLNVNEKAATIQAITDDIHLQIIKNRSFNAKDLVNIATPIMANFHARPRRSAVYISHSTIAPVLFALILTIGNCALSVYVTHRYIQYKLARIPKIALTSLDEYTELNLTSKKDPSRKMDAKSHRDAS